MKSIFLITLLVTSFALPAKEKFEFSITKDSEGYACSKARGESRRKLNAICEKEKKKVNWKNIDISKCKTEKLGPQQYKATYIYKYECID